MFSARGALQTLAQESSDDKNERIERTLKKTKGEEDLVDAQPLKDVFNCRKRHEFTITK